MDSGQENDTASPDDERRVATPTVGLIIRPRTEISAAIISEENREPTSPGVEAMGNTVDNVANQEDDNLFRETERRRAPTRQEFSRLPPF